MKKLSFPILAGLLLFGQAMATTVNENVLNDYAKHAQFQNIKISPKGKYLAATSRTEDGNVILTVLDIKNMAVLSQTQGRGDDSINTFDWVSDDRLIMTMAREVGSYDMPFPTGEIFAMDADGGKQKILTGWRSDGLKQWARIVDLLPEEPNQVMIYSSQNNASEPFIEVYRLKTDTGRVRAEGKIPLRQYKSTNVQILLDDKGITRLAAGVDPKNNNETLIMTRPAANSEWKEVVRFDSNEGGFTPLDILSDNQTVVGLSDISSDTQAISLMNLNTGDISVMAEHPTTDLMPILGFKEGRFHEIIGAAYEYDQIDRVFFEDVDDVAISRTLQSIMKMFPDTQVTISSTTRDNSKMVFSVSSANVPAEFYMFDAKKKSLSLITNSKPWLKKEALPKTQIISYKSRDGLAIKGLLTLPPNKEAKNLPLILLPHGGPHGIRDTLTQLDADAKVLAEHGYAVLQPNFRGSGGYGRKFLEAGYKKWGTAMINDMTDGVNHLIEQGIADKQRMCVYGASYGGYAALMSVIREPDLYKCSIGFVGVYDLNLMFEEGDISEASAGINYLTSVLPTEKNEREAQSPLHQLDKLKVPVFIIQGGKDVRVPPEHAYRLRDALKERNHTYEWLFKEGEGHGFYKPENNIERWKKMLVFIDKHIN